MQDLVDDIEEITQEQIEINIKKFRTEVQIRLDMGEAERDWNDFVRNVINSDDVLKDTNFDKVFEDAKQNLGDLTSYFETKQVEALANKMMQTRQQIESIDATGTSSIYGDNSRNKGPGLGFVLSTIISVFCCGYLGTENTHKDTEIENIIRDHYYGHSLNDSEYFRREFGIEPLNKEEQEKLESMLNCANASYILHF